MIPVDQTRFGDAGNCLAAVVASICHLSLREVPDLRGDMWLPILSTWMREFGWVPVYLDELPPDFTGYCIGLGDGPPRVDDLRPGGSGRGRKHAVVWWGGPNGGIAHDPHPSRDGLIRWPEGYVVFAPLDAGSILVG